MGQNDLHRIRVSTGTHRGQVKNRELSWARFAHQFETPSVDQSLKHADYRAMSVDERTAIKARSGYVVGAQFKDGVRRLANMEKRWVLSFDLDTVTPAQMAQIDMGVSAICGIEFLRHTTRSHIPREPRWRFHVPLRRGVDHEEANAITRILATQLLVDPAESIDVVDVVSHRFAQVSYLPSRSADQEYLYERNEAELLDPGKVLAAFDGNWRDHTQLPMRSDERTARGVDPARKMEDPREKAGVIGAFCRTFDIEAAIARFLPEVYIPGDDMGSLPRYSYALGTSVNGAVVYDDGLFITSHHGSDPIEGSANAWDMVRIHMFGGKDKAAREGTTPGKMPSFKAMSALAITLPEVRTALLSGRQAQFDDDDEPDFDLDDDDDEPPAAPDDLGDFGLGDDVIPWADEFAPVKRKKRKKTAEWESMLQLHPESGAILHTQSNIALILTHGPGLAGTISFCLFTRGLVTRKPVGLPGLPLVREPIPDNWAGREWRDIDEVDRRLLLSSLKDRGGYEMETTVGDIAAAVAYAAKADAFNPIIEQIEAQRWDGVERVASLWIDFLGTPDDCYHRETAQAWCMAAVTRLYEPGHKFDFAPVISGPQGVGKSTFIAALSFGYFRELSDQFDNQSRLIESMHGGWLIEMGELQGLARADVEVVKKFMTAVEDTIRLAYRRNAETFKRQSVFIGTTNKDEYLKDETGRRSRSGPCRWASCRRRPC